MNFFNREFEYFAPFLEARPKIIIVVVSTLNFDNQTHVVKYSGEDIV